MYSYVLQFVMNYKCHEQYINECDKCYVSKCHDTISSNDNKVRYKMNSYTLHTFFSDHITICNVIISYPYAKLSTKKNLLTHSHYKNGK